MVVFPLVIDAINFASLWVLYSFQSEDLFPDFCRLLGSTCQQLKKTRHYYLRQVLAHFGQKTFIFSRLSGNISLLVFKFFHLLKYFYRLSRTSIALSLTRVFPVFHIARRSAFVLAVICVLSYLCCVFVLTFECPTVNAPWYETVAPHCHSTGTAFLVRDVGSACEFFFFHHISLCLNDGQWIFLWTAFSYYSP
jgi:hypothetical protein